MRMLDPSKALVKSKAPEIPRGTAPTMPAPTAPAAPDVGALMARVLALLTSSSVQQQRQAQEQQGALQAQTEALAKALRQAQPRPRCAWDFQLIYNRAGQLERIEARPLEE